MDDSKTILSCVGSQNKSYITKGQCSKGRCESHCGAILLVRKPNNPYECNLSNVSAHKVV